ncbi:two-component system sensor histidine kinase/response regulator [Aureimonas sp. SA4125]|uniref:HWE histidine kinase domain-containing protein n=1 Tax=Aureimonas sp. SA4125 TaxID=2826993 RepID=UPI001CC46369|nr:HWE histidine kinase domain-containing protein [Aureimonas sp. SA4125]BDA85609.1 two-component system sensor histidine kinase/response regulator [Aureimonas sp. SA4125]
MTDNRSVIDLGSRDVLEAKKRLEAIVSSAMDAIITVDERLEIILFNPAAELMFGIASNKAVGLPISTFIPLRFRDGHDQHIRRFQDTGVTGRRMGALGAISGMRSNGEEFRVEASISQIDVSGERLSTVILRDITERLANEEARILLAREVDHRAKNALAVVQAIIALTTADTKEEFIAAISGRMDALARAHSLLAQNSWKGGDLVKIVADETEAYHRPGQIVFRGGNVVVTANAVQPISLLVHELATNAVKYGALSRVSGRVEVAWNVMPGGDLEMRWTESGGPAVKRSASTGFGTTLIKTVLRQLEGEVNTEWSEQGILVRIRLPKAVFKLLRKEPVTQRDDPENGADPSKQLPQLMIVEDELLVAMGMATGLRSQGWDIIGPAGSLDEAYRLLSGEIQPDVAMLDINLNGTPVYPLAGLLQTRGIPFLFCSGYETPDREPRFQHCPLVRKPANLRILDQELRHLVSNHAGSRSDMAI